MSGRAILAVAGLLLGACTYQDGSSDAEDSWDSTESASSTAKESELSYGWLTPIKTVNKPKAGQNSVSGKSLSQIVKSAKVTVRADDKACVTCHSWATYQTREKFCDRVDDFLKMPTLKGDETDLPSSKPASLKKILKDWKEAGCPE